MTTSAPTSTPKPIVELIPLDMLDPSPSNPRKVFIQSEIDELAESLKTHGQLQPALARPSPKKPSRFELVFGEKRRRGAAKLGMPGLLCMVREMTDVQVLETQLVENAKRSDIHPIEEAEAYEALHKKHKYSVDDIAAKVGKSRSAVYASMKLLELVPDARKLFAEGKLNASTALLVARVPASLQKDAAKEISSGLYGDEPMSARAAADHVQRKYMLRLADAPFDRGDAALVKAAGACVTCPKRTGNQVELFADVKSPDTCTDPVCFGKKRDAAWDQRQAEAAAKGQKVLSAKATEEVFPHTYMTEPARDSGLVDLKAKCPDDPKGRTYRQLLGKDHAPEVTVARDKMGKVHELVPKKEAAAALKKAGHKFVKPATADGGSPKLSKGAIAKERAKVALEKATDELLRAKLLPAVLRAEPSDVAMWRLVVRFLVSTSLDGVHDVAKRRGLSPSRAHKVLVDLAAKSKTAELKVLASELIVFEAISGSIGGTLEDLDGLVDAAAETFGVDRKAIAAEAKKKLEKPAEPKVLKVTKAPAKAAKKKGGAK